MTLVGGEVGGSGPRLSPSSEPVPEHDRTNELATAIRNGLRLGGSLLLTWTVAMTVKLQIPAHLGPIRQGHFAFAESFAMIFFSVLSLGIETHVVKEVAVRPAYASEFIGGIFALRSMLAAGLLLAMGTTLVLTGRPDDVLAAALVFGISQFFVSINLTLAAVLQAVSNVGRLAMANVVGKVVWGAGVMLGLYYDAPLWLLAVPMATAELLKTAALVPSATIAASLRYRINIPAARGAIVASLPFFVNAVAITFGGHLALSSLEFIHQDEREVGWFAASQNIAALAMLLQPLLAWVIMPMLSRAQSRSAEEKNTLLRRAVEALLVLVAPGTVFISASADVLVGLAFGEAYAPASLGLSILSLVFLMTYMNYMLACGLILDNRGWSVTLISIGSVCLLAVLMLVCVPLGSAWFGTGGECAGAAIAVILSEMCIVVAMLTRFDESPLDQRNIAVLLKSVGISAVALTLNHFLRELGPVRLLIVMAVYVALALALRVVQPADVASLIRVLKSGRGGSSKA